MLTRTLNAADLQPRNGIRYQPLHLIGPEELSTLGFGWAVVDPGGRTAGHSHPEPECYVVIQGEATMRIGDESAPVSAGQAVFVPSGEHHQILNQGLGVLVYVAVYWHPELDRMPL